MVESALWCAEETEEATERRRLREGAGAEKVLVAATTAISASLTFLRDWPSNPAMNTVVSPSGFAYRGNDDAVRFVRGLIEAGSGCGGNALLAERLLSRLECALSSASAPPPPRLLLFTCHAIRAMHLARAGNVAGVLDALERAGVTAMEPIDVPENVPENAGRSTRHSPPAFAASLADAFQPGAVLALRCPGTLPFFRRQFVGALHVAVESLAGTGRPASALATWTAAFLAANPLARLESAVLVACARAASADRAAAANVDAPFDRALAAASDARAF
jgi:hypothetical protein